MNKRILRWLLRKAYEKEIDAMYETVTSQRNQINNLKERINYLQSTNIFNFEERKYRK